MTSARVKVAVAAAAAGVAAYLYYRYRRSKKGTTDENLVLRSAYKPSHYQIETVDLNFILTEEEAVCESVIKFVGTGVASPLYLDGEDLDLRSIKMDGVALTQVSCCSPRLLTRGAAPFCPRLLAHCTGRDATTFSARRRD